MDGSKRRPLLHISSPVSFLANRCPERERESSWGADSSRRPRSPSSRSPLFVCMSSYHVFLRHAFAGNGKGRVVEVFVSGSVTVFMEGEKCRDRNGVTQAPPLQPDSWRCRAGEPLLDVQTHGDEWTGFLKSGRGWDFMSVNAIY